MDFIPYSRQSLDEQDIEAVVETLRSSFLTTGPKVEGFEQAICDYTGAKFCVAVSSGTAALHLAVRALDLEAGTEGITTTNSFIASANCMLHNDITPILADIEEVTLNLSSKTVEEKLSEKTKLLLPVHFAGRPCDMECLSRLAGKNGCVIIEDASHAMGSSYSNGKKVGACCYSAMTTFSFHPVKNITSGEGGAITTNSRELYEKLLSLRGHGIVRDRSRFIFDELALEQNCLNGWYYEMQELGFNYRLSDIHASLGLSQLSKLDKFSSRKQAIWKMYDESFVSLKWIQTPEKEGLKNLNMHLYVIRVDFESLGITRTQMMQTLKLRGIGTQVHYIPIHYQPYYRERYRLAQGDLPVAQKYYNSSLSIPFFAAMSDQQVSTVVENILSFGKIKEGDCGYAI